jgi:hypothetical protein
VTLSDNDSNTAVYNFPNAKPGDTVTKCLNVSYTGSLDSDVKLYVPEAIGALGANVNLTITPGTQASPSFPSCTGFNPDSGGAIYTGTLSAFASAHSSWANGLATTPPSLTKWSAGNSAVYQITATLDSGVTGTGGGTTNSHSLTWESRNQ